jgi:hypothetical protein
MKFSRGRTLWVISQKPHFFMLDARHVHAWMHGAALGHHCCQLYSFWDTKCWCQCMPRIGHWVSINVLSILSWLPSAIDTWPLSYDSPHWYLVIGYSLQHRAASALQGHRNFYVSCFIFFLSFHVHIKLLFF